MTWHASTDAVTAYAAGQLDGAAAASLEAHLAVCGICQRTVAGATPALAPRLDRVWTAVTDELDRPRVTPLERVLRRILISETDARLIVTTPALLTSWTLATLAAVLFAILPTDASGRGAFFYLCVAPLLPLAGVGLAFSHRFDPLGEITIATPVSILHLVLVRGAAVLAPAVAALAVGAAAVPAVPAHPAAWLLPALALCACSLAASTWIEPVRAAGALAALWVSVVTLAAATQERAFGTSAADLAQQGHTHAVLAAVTAIAVALFAVRRQQLELGRTR